MFHMNKQSEKISSCLLCWYHRQGEWTPPFNCVLPEPKNLNNRSVYSPSWCSCKRTPVLTLSGPLWMTNNTSKGLGSRSTTSRLIICSSTILQISKRQMNNLIYRWRHLALTRKEITLFDVITTNEKFLNMLCHIMVATDHIMVNATKYYNV